MKSVFPRNTISAFALAGMVWGVLAALVQYQALGFYSIEQIRALFLLWLVSFLNFLCLYGLYWTLSKGAAQSSELIRASNPKTLLFFASAKFASLILLGSLIWQSGHVPGITLFLGLSTMIVVPLLGGMIFVGFLKKYE